MIGPVCPPTCRLHAIHSASETAGPTASNVPTVPACDAASSHPARSRASTTWVGWSGESGTSIGACRSRAARATQ